MLDGGATPPQQTITESLVLSVGACVLDTSKLSYLVDTADDKLFESILSTPYHVLHAYYVGPPAITTQPTTCAHDVTIGSSAKVLFI